jgi:hypothetical protein
MDSLALNDDINETQRQQHCKFKRQANSNVSLSITNEVGKIFSAGMTKREK